MKNHANHLGHISGRMTRPGEEPQAAPSRSVAEGIVVIEMTGPWVLLPLETFSWDKMWLWQSAMLMIWTLCGPGMMICVFVS